VVLVESLICSDCSLLLICSSITLARAGASSFCPAPGTSTKAGAAVGALGFAFLCTEASFVLAVSCACTGFHFAHNEAAMNSDSAIMVKIGPKREPRDISQA